MIRFSCKNCGQRLNVPENHGGKKGKCPKCKSILIVPKAVSANSTTKQRDSGDVKIQSKDSPYDLTLLDMSEGSKIQYGVPRGISEDTKEFEHESPTEEVENAGECKFPWIIDIFFYPISVSGMIHLAIFSFLPQMLLPLAHLNYWLSPPIFGLGFLVIYIGYLFFCLSDYIFESSKGNRRAPDSKISIKVLFHIEELLSPILNIFVCVAFCFSPLLAYFMVTKQVGLIFGLLVTYGIFFLPMVLLAVVMFDSFWVLNPIFTVGSMLKVFFQYCGLVLLFFAFGGLIALITLTLLQNAIVGYIFGIVCIYLVIVMAHLLGRFYWWHKDKLGWGI